MNLTKYFRTREECLAERQRIILYKRVFGTAEGRQVLFDLINRNFVYDDIPEGDGKKLGRRAAILEVIKSAKLSIAELDQLLTPEGERLNGSS